MSLRRAVAIVMGLMLMLPSAGCAPPAPRVPTAPRPRFDLSTPMPTAFDVELARPDLPAAISGLAGIWKGDWLAGDQPAGSPGTPHTLVVKRLEGAGPAFTALVIWSVGAAVGGADAGDPGFVELAAAVTADGALRVAVPGRGDVAYRLSADGHWLVGEGVLSGHALRATLSRYPEWGAPSGSGRDSTAPETHPAAPSTALTGGVLVVGARIDQIR